MRILLKSLRVVIAPRCHGDWSMASTDAFILKAILKAEFVEEAIAIKDNSEKINVADQMSRGLVHGITPKRYNITKCHGDWSMSL